MENSTKQQQETPKKQWIEPAMEVLQLQKAGADFYDSVAKVSFNKS